MRNLELENADIARSEVIQILLSTLFTTQNENLKTTINNFILNFEGCGSFFVINKNFEWIGKDKPGYKIKDIYSDSSYYEEAKEIYITRKELWHDYGIIEHFLAMFLNRVRHSEDFYDIFPQAHLENMILKSKNKQIWKSFQHSLTVCINFRQRTRGTEQHQYEIFLNDNQEKIDLMKRYFVENMLLN